MSANSQAKADYRAASTEIMDLSQSILDHARQGHWQDLPDLMQRRHGMMTSLFADPSGSDGFAGSEEVDDVADDIHKIQVMNEEITLLAEDARQDITSNIQSLQRGRKASHLYSEISV